MALGDALNIGLGTSGQVVQSNGTTLTLSTATYPLTTTINQLLFSSAANTVTGIATGNNGTLITSAGGVPSISSTLPTAVQSNITQLGAQSQALNMNSNLINNVADPVSSQDVATKNYVDQVATGGGAPVVAATTGALTVVYNNGTSGVGATLTNAGAQAAFSIDGQSPTVGQRVLIKNQASSLQNGVYTVTNVGSGATNWVLTRATDYDTPANINATSLIPVSAGTANANTGWINTTLMVTVGTTAITFVQFGITVPVSLANGGTNASLTASNGGIFYSTGSAGAILSGTATANQVLLSGSNAAPAWSTATYPATTTINQLLYSSAANTVAGLATATTAVLTTSAGVPTWANQLSLALGGTNAALTADNGAIVYSTGSALALLAHTTTAGLALLSGNNAAPTWSTSKPITQVNRQTISATGAFTYTPTTGTQYAIFEFVGAGGGSGGTTGAANQQATGGAGASGSYLKILVSGSANLAAITGSVGTGGLAGTSGNNAGGNGGNTTLTINGGTQWVAAGGNGGSGQASSATVQSGGSGGASNDVTVGTNATLISSIRGQTGAIGFTNGASFPGVPAQGGHSHLGNGGYNNQAALGAGGGGGGFNNFTGANSVGFAGGNGAVIVTEFISV